MGKAIEEPEKKSICIGLLAHVDAGKTTLPRTRQEKQVNEKRKKVQRRQKTAPFFYVPMFMAQDPVRQSRAPA